MPLSGPAAAACMAALMASTLVALERMTVRSTSETSGTGTRSAMPWNLPLSSGRIRATALAAPVARGVGDDVVPGRVVRLLVAPHHDGQVLVLRGRGDDHLARTGGDVGLGFIGVGEQARRLDDDVR